MEKNCGNCKHYETIRFKNPCNECSHLFGQKDNWEPMADTNFDKITASPETLAEYMCMHEWKMADYQKCVDWLETEADGQHG